MAVLGIKPVRQCAGCALNLGKTCAIFHHPSLKWKERRCEGYNNPMYIQHYEKTLKPQGAPAQQPASKPARAARAKPARPAVRRRKTRPVKGRR